MSLSDTEKVSRNIYLYVLKCVEDRYYIGIAYSIKKRLRTHFNKRERVQGVVFLKFYEPLKCIEILDLQTENRDEAELYETYKTIEYAKKYGSGHVAGAAFVVRDEIIRKKSIENAIKNNAVNVHGKRYFLNDNIILSRLEKSKINELYGLTPEQISEAIIKERTEGIIPHEKRCLNFNDILPFISNIENLKYKAIIALSLIYKNKPYYICRIKFENINRKEMTIDIPIKHNKFSKAPLDSETLNLLENYYRNEQYKPIEFLFGQRIIKGEKIYFFNQEIMELFCEIKKQMQ